MLRRLILGWASCLVRSYYRFERAGEVPPAHGPLIAVSNHTNGMVDGVALIEASGRPLRLLVKHELLRVPILGWIVRRVAAVPIFRSKDQAPPDANAGAFQAIDAALAEGEAIGVFPEGTSHLDAGIRPLRTGAARIALAAEEAAHWELGLRVLPIGIHYEDRARFQSRALMVVGPPLAVAPFRDRHRAGEWDAALELTAEIHRALEHVRVELDEREAAPLLALVLDELHDGAVAAVEAPGRLRALTLGWRALHERDPERARERLARLRELESTRRPTGGPRALYLAQRWSGWLAWALPALGSRAIARTLPLPLDKHPTVFLLSASVLFPVWLVTLAAWSGSAFGAFAGVAVALVFVGLGRNALRAERAWNARALAPEAAEERAAIAAELSRSQNETAAAPLSGD